MRMSMKWLRDYVDFDYSADELEERLVLSGTAVEAVHHLGTGAKKVYVGQILDIQAHPNADRLTLCAVTLGDNTAEFAGKEQLQIVCGAKNMKVGDKVPVALVGATLPGGMVLEGRKIRGITSEGMLCSAVELGLGEEAEGLMILDPSQELGRPIDEALGLDDTVFELEITPNRPDCMSMIGMAREVAALARTQLRIPPADVREGEENVKALADIEVRDTERCPRYMGRVIRGVTIGPSPAWMQQRLHAAGMRPINNVVDITNFVMLETGQPLHAFDYHRLAGGKIIVRRARDKEEIVTLDGVRRVLSSEDLVIADAEKPVALAGVMGSEPAEVHDDTVDVLLESAYFRPQNIMATARGIGLITESSARFERGTDPEGVQYACDRAAALIAEYAGGTVSRGRVDIYAEPVKPRQLTLRTRRCRDVMGAEVSDEAIVEYLNALQLETRLVRDRVVPGAGMRHEATAEVLVPTFRRDLEREIDLIEEVARLYGYNNVPTTLPRHSAEEGGFNPRQTQERALRGTLMGMGLAEVLSNTLVAQKDFERLTVAADSPLLDMVTLRNPLGEEYAKLRSTLLPGLLDNLHRNINWGCEGHAVFEIGRVFKPRRSSVTSPKSTEADAAQAASTKRIEPDAANQPHESLHLGILLWGRSQIKGWSTAESDWDFYDLKGMLELIWERILGLDLDLRRIDHPLLHPGSGVSLLPLPAFERGPRKSETQSLLLAGESAGWAGELHPTLPGRFGIEGSVFAAEIDLDLILTGEPVRRPYRGLPRYPGISIDLSLLVDEDVPAQEVLSLIRSSAGNLLAEVRLFDLYRGGQVPAGKKSLAYSLLYRSDERTLTDDEVGKIQDRVVRKLSHAGIEVRGT